MLSKVSLGGVRYDIKDAQARADLDDLSSTQRCLDPNTPEVEPLPTVFPKIETTDPAFLRYKTYFKKDGDTWVQLTIGVDYFYGQETRSFGETVYEDDGWTVRDMYNGINNSLNAFNLLIPLTNELFQEGTRRNGRVLSLLP